MAYIGRDTDKLSNIEVLDAITFDGSSSYTLQKNSVNFTPSSANNVLVSIDGVVQANNFTVSGSTIDFGVAVPSTSTCDWIYHIGVGLITTPADGTVSLAKLSATGTKDSTTFLRGDNTFSTLPASGITETDQWRVSATFTKSGSGASDITANWERNDTTYSIIGTGMTESSGIFSFPSTGIYLVEASASIYAFGAARSYGGILLQATTDNSSYSSIARGYEGMYTGDAYGNINVKSIFDVTNITTHKIKLTAETVSDVKYEGSTSENKTYLTFIRLGDT